MTRRGMTGQTVAESARAGSSTVTFPARMSVIAMVIMLPALLSVSHAVAGTVTYTVKQDGTGDYTTISDAVAAVPADLVADGNNYIIEIQDNGVYSEEVTISSKNCNATYYLKIQAGSGYSPVLRNQASLSIGIYIDSTNYVHIKGIDIEDYPSRGIEFVSSTYGTVESCDFNDNTARGLYFNSSNNGTVTGCTFDGNGTGGWSLAGLYFANSDNGTVSGCTFTNNNSKGIYTYQADYINVSNSSFTSNGGTEASSAGIHYYKNSDHGTVDTCTFTTNDNKGVYFYDDSDNGTVNNCTFTNDVSTAVYFQLNSDNGTVTDSDITGGNSWGIRVNEGGTGYTFDHNTVTNAYKGIGMTSVTNSEVSFNKVDTCKTGAEAGIEQYSGSGNDIWNNVVIDSYRGIHLYDSTSATIYNNTVINNEIAQIILTGTSAATIKNNIMKHAGANTDLIMISFNSRAGTTADYNDYYKTAGRFGSWGSDYCANITEWRSTSGQGANSIEDNPDFVSPPSNLKLESYSPCVNAGTTIASITEDMNGTSRPQGSAYDIGAYEYQATLIELVRFDARPCERSSCIALEWETGSEIDAVGFNLWRSGTMDDNYEKINASRIPSRGSPLEGASYAFVDPACPTTVCYYKLEDIDLNGTSIFHGPIEVIPQPGLCGTMPDATGFVIFQLFLPFAATILWRRKRKAAKP